MRVTEVRKAGWHIKRRPERKAYDALDRIIRTVLPGGTYDEYSGTGKRVQTMRYGITDDGLSYTETTDPKGNIDVQYADARENIVKVERKGNDEKGNFGIRTSATYEYDAMGQMVAAYDAARNPITVMYDMLGRKTELTTKDGGAKRYTYDELHLLYEDDEVMRQSGSRIDYSYDGFNRVIKIEYPEGGDVEYEYGAYGAANNSAGKVISVRDEAGETRYEYGKLGEVVKETRTLKRHIPAYESEKTAVMEYVSDYLGRMQSITYPDREVVTYGYDAGGQVCSITGERDGRDYTYVADIRYDEYGQRVYIKYGNGVETNYTYDENMRWLKHIDTENTYGTQYQNIVYSFDDVGNVESYENNCMNGARYSTSQSYKYDALYQLIFATGTTEDNPYAIPNSPDYRSNYEQNFSFDAIGNMTHKDSTETITPAKRKQGGDDLIYEFTYQYDTNYAHRLTRAGSEQKGWRYYTYDANGNVTSESDGVAPNEETTTLTPVTVTTHTNEEGSPVYEADYAWAWPWSDSDTGGSKPTPRNKRTYEWNSRNLLMRSVVPDYDTCYAYSADGNRAAKWTSTKASETLYFNTMWTWHIEKRLSQEQHGQYSKHIYLGETRLVTKQTSDLEEHYGPSEELRHQYYYHPDHLGSAQLVTDYEGNEYQRIEYTPYGELWVEKKTANEKDMRYLPYKFTAKEMDEETGLYYYGARYLDAKYSRWLSADPAVKDYIPQTGGDNARLPNGGMYNYTNLSLYHYSNNNPIKYTDPDGNSPLWFGLGQSGFGHEAPQRVFGFKDSMDDKSWCFGFDLHATAFKTDNFTLRLWKGNYVDVTSLLYPMIPGGAGGEIGLYNPDGSSMSKSDLAALGIVGSEISVTNKITGKTIASHKEKSASFWTTVFSWFNKLRKEELSTKNALIFDTDEHAADFESKIKNKKTSDDAKAYPHNKNESIEIYRVGNRVIINYGDE